ncbi:RNA polymerase sigma-70 factor, ECF subfamily [Saccharicrinis carchari]|uniref:RNA polymerase sigma-70 factor, ECF subfamily n=1 Tax=Saccharicrinis carchari TaxID=1168039 RepID=A0A521C6F5_SACCC|nr:RNA polymerase sigma-70 factor [Saccharicrinis carchari]SMO55026.1 RNA polymerase sigma-70 factor, ECF subfamily [Saccharicrinis carchari]
MLNIKQEHITKISQGDERVFKEIFEDFYPKLVGVAMKYINNMMVSEDIVAEVFTKVWEKRAQITEIGSFESYLYTSVRNAVFNHVRNTKRKEDHHEKILSNLSEQTFEETVVEENVHHRLYKAIENLPEQGRKVFELSVINNWKEKEIAEDLNISVNTVKTHKKRALKSLRDQLGRWEDS